MSKSHVVQFFSSYSNFTLNRSAAPTKEFLRLTKQYQWKKGSKKYTKARELFADAVAEDFNAKFGTDVNNIDHWHALCHVLRIDPIPRNISASRKAVESQAKHINLIDLVYHTDKVRTFPSVKALAEYSIENDKVFPKTLATGKAGGILRHLLRPLSKYWHGS